MRVSQVYVQCFCYVLPQPADLCGPGGAGVCEHAHVALVRFYFHITRACICVQVSAAHYKCPFYFCSC